ncbi:MAG TPA: helix-turn-helix transcriptional regulator, partial [Candidatus Binatia bacterium]
DTRLSSNLNRDNPTISLPFSVFADGTFAQRLKKLRVERGLKQAELSLKAGLNNFFRKMANRRSVLAAPSRSGLPLAAHLDIVPCRLHAFAYTGEGCLDRGATHTVAASHSYVVSVAKRSRVHE